MRIVGGKYKGRVLVGFDGQNVRPTSDMVRESLFNILQFKIHGTDFLDLFCGTGAIGIEAVSRGAKRVTFNDSAKSSINILKQNLNKLGVLEDCTIKNYDAVELLKGGVEQYDFIYIDPPYKSDLGLKSLQVCDNALKENGMAIFEDEKPFDGQVQGLVVCDRRKYGRVHLTFFRKGE